MSYLRFISESYLAQLLERQEDAFRRWSQSGYRDFAAHDEWLSWRDRAMKQKANMREPVA